MDSFQQLKNKVVATQSPSRSLIVHYLKTLVEMAKQQPVKDRDWIAYEILRPFVELDQPPLDPELDYIVFQLVGSDLDTNREETLNRRREHGDEEKWRKFKADKWRELIERVEQLS